MWLPLSKPGGSFVATRNAFNDMLNNRALRKYNETKADWAGTTIPAQAYSQMAYANAVAPQFMAKLLQDPKFLGNISPAQAQSIKNAVLSGATKPPGFNALNQTQENAGGGGGGLGNAFNESPAGQLWSGLKNLLGKHGTQLSPNPMQQQNMQQPMPQQLPQANNNAPGIPSQEAAPEAQAQTSANYESQKEALYKKFIESPEGQAEIDKYNRGEPSRLDLGADALKESLVNEANGKPLELELKGGNNPPADEGDYITNAARAVGILQQGKKGGDYRAEAVKDIGNEQKVLTNTGNVINEVIGDFTDPEFVALRAEFPYLQNMQLEAASHLKDPRVQEKIGKIIGDLESFKAATVNSFKGQTLKREFEFADKIKPSQSDTVYTALGKMEALKSLHDIAEKKNSLVNKYIEKDHLSQTEAIDRANKEVNVGAIRNKVKELTQPLHEFQNKKTGVTIYLTSNRAKELGLKNNPVGVRIGKSNVR